MMLMAVIWTICCASVVWSGVQRYGEIGNIIRQDAKTLCSTVKTDAAESPPADTISDATGSLKYCKTALDCTTWSMAYKLKCFGEGGPAVASCTYKRFGSKTLGQTLQAPEREYWYSGLYKCCNAKEAAFITSDKC